MRQTRIGLIAALTAVLVLGLVPSALASDGEVDLSGYGWLAARGTGEAALDMGGWIEVRIDGDVSIVDVAGDAQVRIRSAEEDAYALASRPEVELSNFNGWVAVRGHHFVIRLKGDIRFRAHGHGFAYLEGSGIYRTRNGHVRTWSSSGAEVEISADAA